MSSNNPKKTKKNDKQEEGEEKPRELTPQEAAIIEMLKQTSLGEPKTEQEQKHTFWDTQPMPHSHNKDLPEGPVVPDKTKEELRQEPYNMPAGYTWSNINVEDETERKELYDLLANNYVEDDDCLFRFDYSPEFLMWALTPPGWTSNLLLGVRSTAKNKLVAFISGVPARVRAYTNQVDMVEINFLCVHKKLRSKRLAPVLIKEITRRVNHTDVFQAVYTAGVVLPVPVASARYNHRSLNPKKLVNVGFSRLAPRMTMARLQKLYKLPTETKCEGLVPMEPSDVPGVHEILTKYLQKFSMAVMFSEEEVAHWILPREGVINSYVIRDESGKVTDLCSFYHLPSTILGRDDSLFAAYSFYNVANSVDWPTLMKDCLILAKNGGADVFNALNLMDNDEFLQELKFGLGDGHLQYYLYNWNCPQMEHKDIGIVLL